MLFNSFPFLALFLPLALAGFFLLGRQGRRWATVWLLLTSLAYYCTWDFRYLPVLLFSITANYLFCQRLIRPGQPGKKVWLAVAVCFNLALLGYFKYANFFISSFNGLTAGNLRLLEIILPIGISFFTFTQLSFLVDAYHGKIREVSPLQYALFASYFPYIVAGPVLHHRDMLPQFADSGNFRLSGGNIAAGLTLFAFGLGKKLLIADNLVPLVDVAFGTANPQLLQAWLGLFAYSFQLYFDFSGYSDMAIGVSRLFGFQIPFNFNSPYKAASVSEFWLRWHISLSRFLRNYLYIPLGGNRQGQMSRYRNLLLTMLLGGLWHGANWTFVIWGGLHGLYLCVQHGWRGMFGGGDVPPGRGVVFCNRVLTFLAVMVAWCFFRAPDVASALGILTGMVGGNGFSAVAGVALPGYLMLAVSAGIALYLPNTNEFVGFFESRFDNKPASVSLVRIQWAPTLRWGVVTGIILALGLLSMDQTKDFIYAQF